MWLGVPLLHATIICHVISGRLYTMETVSRVYGVKM